MICPKCGGRGRFQGTVKFYSCPSCKGHGEISHYQPMISLKEAESAILNEIMKVVNRFGWRDAAIRKMARNVSRVRAGEEME